MKKVISLIICGILMVSMFGGCAGTTQAPSQASSAKTEQPASTQPSADQPSTDQASAEKPSYVIATNNWGVGAYPLDIIFEAIQFMTDSTGTQQNMANNEFKADKVISDLQNQIATGVDGVAFFGISQTMFTTAAQICEQTKLPFAFYSNAPADSDIETIKKNPYFLGYVVCNQYSSGAQMAEMALADGNRTAIISAAAIGDFAHDQRIAGFTDTFEAGGGKVEYVAHSADPSEGVQKANDAMTAFPDADAIYCTGGDFLTAALNAIESRSGADYKMYGTDLSPDLAQQILDGNVVAINGMQHTEGSIAATLIINYLDGHQILAPDGGVPLYNHLSMVAVNKDTAKAYMDFVAGGGSMISPEEYQNLLYRFNPDVNYQTYYDFIENYESIVVGKF